MPHTTVRKHGRKKPSGGYTSIKRHSRNYRTKQKRIPHTVANERKAEYLHALYVYNTNKNIKGRHYWGSLKEMGLLEGYSDSYSWVAGYTGFPREYGYYAKRAQIDNFYVNPDTNLTPKQVKSYFHKNMTYKTPNLMYLAERMLIIEERVKATDSGMDRDKAWDQYSSALGKLEYNHSFENPKTRIKRLKKRLK